MEHRLDLTRIGTLQSKIREKHNHVVAWLGGDLQSGFVAAPTARRLANAEPPE
jgi:hypothetical protein